MRVYIQFYSRMNCHQNIGSPPPLVSINPGCHDLRFQDSRFKIQDSKFRIQNSRFKIQDSKFKIFCHRANLYPTTTVTLCSLHLDMEIW